MNWLDKLLRYWGKNTNLQSVANVCHAALAYSAMLTVGPKYKWTTTAVIVGLTLIKEFWFDLHYEDPATSGGVRGGIKDFVGYLTGIGAGLLRFAIASVVLAAPLAHYRHHDGILLPDLTYTPGHVRTTDLWGPAGICTTTTEAYRHTTEGMKKQACAAYGVKHCPAEAKMEIDHSIALTDGGADSQDNLWVQMAPQFKWKDRLEDTVHRKMCDKEQHMDAATVSDFQKRMATDWYQLYLDLGLDKAGADEAGLPSL